GLAIGGEAGTTRQGWQGWKRRRAGTARSRWKESLGHLIGGRDGKARPSPSSLLVRLPSERGLIFFAIERRSSSSMSRGSSLLGPTCCTVAIVAGGFFATG